MNNYPIWWDTPITVYNRYEDAQTQVVSWHRTTIPNCFWKYAGDKVTIGQTTLETNDIICRIPKQGNFLERYEWVQLPNDTMQGYFTLGAGDIIVKGAVTEDIDEYLTGHRSSDFVAKYKALQGCMIVEQVSVNVGMGRGNEHYFVKGK